MSEVKDAVRETVTVARVGTDGADDHRWWDDGRRRVLVALSVLALLGGVALAWHLDRGLPDDVAFEVAGKQTSVDEVRDRAATLRALYGVQMPTDAKGRDRYWRDIAQSMVIGEVLADQAERRGTTVPTERLDASLTSYLESTFGKGEAGRSAYLRALSNAGTSDEEVRAEIERQLLVAALFDDVTEGVDKPTADEVASSFDRWRCYFDRPESRVLSNIVVLTRSDANAVLRRLREGSPFAAVARERSLDQSSAAEGGDLGAHAAAELESGYADTAFAAKVAVPFGPVATEDGWNVGVVRRVIPARPAAFAKVAPKVAELEHSELKLEAWRSWLEDALRGASAEYADDYRPEDPDQLPDDVATAPGGSGQQECR